MIHSEVAAKHVFVVENDKNMSHALRYNLEANGYRVTTHTDGLEAAEQMQAGDIDLVAFDLDSPLMPGIMLVDALRIHHGDVPVLLLSSLSWRTTKPRVRDRNRGFRIQAF